MSRHLTHSSRRLLTVAALLTATAVPSVVIAGQSAAGAKTNGITATKSSTSTTPATVAPDSVKWK